MKRDAPGRIKALLQIITPSRYPPVLVSSLGRSGSTLVFEAIRDGMSFSRFKDYNWIGRKVSSNTAFDLGRTTIRPGVVYKTHALASEMPDHPAARVVFLFGSASDAALSVLSCRERYGEEWIKQHFINLRAKGTIDDLPSRDVLRFEEQLDGWLALKRVPVLALKYDDLWENQDVISSFLRFPVSLPPRRARESLKYIDDGVLERVRSTYSPLDERIAALPSVLRTD